ncbi:MAG: protein translocase subunit SecF [Bdellovibrionales bacterium]|nr:protein translocase subunit SecF [Bdellovibrionales bacterium]
MAVQSNTKTFDFLGKRYWAYLLSGLLIAFTIYEWTTSGDAKFGIDYLGGHELIVKVQDQKANSEAVRNQLSKDKIDAIVQAFEAGSDEFSIRITSQEKSGVVREKVLQSLEKAFAGEVEILKADFVGPTIGEELKKDAVIALLVSLLGMLAYITWRFEMAFAVGAVIALFHDVIVTMGIYLLCGNTISVATLAAALTIVGYSVNDTIIIFDRVREEILSRKDFDLDDLINYSITQTLSRTIITSVLTLLSALALLVYGGGAIADLSLFLCVGIVTGTYSTIFIASPVAIAWENFRHSTKSGGAKEGLKREVQAQQR